MKIVPQIAADLDDYPELRTLADVALRRVAELMAIHGISGLHRLRKSGVFDRPYKKDVVSQIGFTGLPQTVIAGQHTVGEAILDYLEAIGISGVSLELSQDDVRSIASLWSPPGNPPIEQSPAKATDGLDPRPADSAVTQPSCPEPVKQDSACKAAQQKDTNKKTKQSKEQ